jgi:hypothetical protein
MIDNDIIYLSITAYFNLGLMFYIYLEWRFPDEVFLFKFAHHNLFTYFLSAFSTILFFPIVIIYLLHLAIKKYYDYN